MLAETTCSINNTNDCQNSKPKNDGSLNHNGNKSTVPVIFRSQKVQPLLVFSGSFEFVEVRPGRTLRIYRSHGTASQNQTKELQNTPVNCTGPKEDESSGLVIQRDSENSCDIPVPHSSKTDLNKTETSMETINSNEKPKEADLAGKTDTKESSTTEADPKESYQTRITTASSIRFSVRVVPSSSGPTEDQRQGSVEGDTAMFLLHGVGGSVEVWNLQINYFEKLNYEIVAMDFIGHGQSSSPLEPKAYTFKEISDDILAVFDRFRKTQNIVVGHSYGSCFSALLARYRSRFITKLVLISGGSPLPLLPEWYFRCFPLCLLCCCQRTVKNLFLKRSFYSSGYTNSTYDAVFSIPSHVLKYVMNGQDWLEGNIEFHSWITAPTLLIHGKHDQLVSAEEVNLMNKDFPQKNFKLMIFYMPRFTRTFEDVLEFTDCTRWIYELQLLFMLQTVPRSQLLVVEDAGHMVMIEKSEEVNQMIRDFLLSTVSQEEGD